MNHLLAFDVEHIVELKRFQWNNFQPPQALVALWDEGNLFKELKYCFERLFPVFYFSLRHNVVFAFETLLKVENDMS